MQEIELGTGSSQDYKKDGILSEIWDGRGVVWAATHIPTQTQLAIKVFDLEKCSDDFDLIQYEARMLREVRAPQLCSVMGSLSSGHEAWLIMPRHLCSTATLLTTCYPTGLPEPAIALIVRDILQALIYLHARGIIHRAVQARHVLVSCNGRAVLSGLRHSIKHDLASSGGGGGSGGYNCALHTFPRHPVALLNWASPEMLHQDLRGYSYPSDVYSLGLTVCELANAERPYQDLPATLMLVEKLKGLVPFIHDSDTLQGTDGSLSNSSHSLDTNEGLHIEHLGGKGAAVGGAGAGAGAGGGGGSGRADSERSSTSSLSSKQAAQQQRSFSRASHQFVRNTLALDPQHRPTPANLLNTDAFIRQVKRTHANSSLIKLLHLQNVDFVQKGAEVTKELEEKLSQASIDDTSWEFDTT